MRWLILAALLASPVAAQSSGSLDPDDVLPLLGEPWSEAKTLLTPADSGHVVGKGGTLLWRSSEDDDVSALYLTVRGGFLVDIVVAAAPESCDAFDSFVASTRSEIGEPGPDGFYRADQLPQAGPIRDLDAEVGFDEEARTMTIRVPDASRR